MRRSAANCSPVRGETGKTWDQAVKTKDAIEKSGNEVLLIPQPAASHTIQIGPTKEYWEHIRLFLWKHLSLKEFRE
jgi:hypothetical protein